MNTEPLDVIPLWAFPIVAGALLVVAMEFGYRLGRWRHAHLSDEKEVPVGSMVASILGLLALVLGFTFSLAANRFDGRRQALLEEANAIGTTYLRARLLDEPQKSQVMNLLRQYVDVRLSVAKQRPIEEVLKESEVIHEQLWKQADDAAEKNSGSIMTGLFIQSLNNLIDLHAVRVLAGLRSRIPVVVWALLVLLALIGMTSVGYQAGLSGTRRSPAMLGLIVSFLVVLVLIADLDRVDEGMIRVSQQPLVDLQRSMQAETIKPSN